jgi:hypothetical protein
MWRLTVLSLSTQLAFPDFTIFNCWVIEQSSVACIIKLFTAVAHYLALQSSVSAYVSHLHPNLIFEIKAVSSPATVLTANIRLR